MVMAAPLTESCARPLASREHVCIGVSPFNSYFSVQRIADLARWARRSFDSFQFFVPDRVAAHTLRALGYPPERAEHKAARQGQYVHNKICRALAEVGITDVAGYILDSATLLGNSAYQRLSLRVHTEFADNPEFAEQCMQASGWVLEKRLPAGTPATREQLTHAVRYFLAEIPMFLDTVAIAGVSSSVFAYHQRVGFLERLYQHELALTPHPAQGFVVLTEEEL
ncbi:tRNA-dependent cyclodipeptide synthase [Actinokineospora sp. NBRC 105648]|uniref:tRNA-dependent cyclodipeptide synthase n=1 Tax=Actinokineospora sp. NBRC 105648 TaxID=3032206 RepID=UPI0024A58DD1|nr:tRNA-dependent cyclodipeptide synthase [Actinokineospora sp. NBRC 105648]GLZ36939.1 cyclo(L-leucyl-L-leucyl) synthase [Actinokineospora sp. NBRC 105648]